MIAGGGVNPRPEPRSETGNDPDPASQPLSAAIRELPAASDTGPRPSRSLAGAIKRLFREVKKAITGEAPAPQPKQRRRKRDEDTRGLFKKLAIRILSPVLRSIFDRDNFTCFTPPDELDETQRLMLREWYSQDAMRQHDDNHAFHHDQSNYLFPHF